MKIGIHRQNKIPTRKTSKQHSLLPLFIVNCSLLIVLCSCPSPFRTTQRLEAPEGFGIFSLSINTQRTIMPDTSPLDNFAVYELIFDETTDGEDYTERFSAATSHTVTLAVGMYDVTLNAYLGGAVNAPIRLAASGTLEDVEITSGASVFETITLFALRSKGTGIFDWSVNISASDVKSAVMTIKKNNEHFGDSPITLNPSGETSGNPSLAYGVYNVHFTLIKEDAAEAVWDELLYIYGELESSFSIEFDDDYFFRTHYTVTFVFNNGETSDLPRSVMHGDTAPELAPTHPTPGYTFAGWYTENTFANLYDFSNPVAGNITLYAKWNGTPVAADYNIGNLTQTAGSVTAVTITAKAGKSGGGITVHYEGIPPISYNDTTPPQIAGTYTVTFDVAPVSGWNAASGLFAGTLTVNLPIPIAADFDIGKMVQTTEDTITDVTITPRAGKSQGGITFHYEGISPISYNGTIPPQGVGTYNVTFNVDAATGWAAATNLIAGTLTVVDPDNVITVADATEWANLASNPKIAAGDPSNFNYYLVNVTQDINDAAGVTSSSFGTDKTYINVTINSDDKTITLSDTGSLLRVSENQTVIMNNLTLVGYSGNNIPLVYIYEGEFIMNSGVISGNKNSTNSSMNSSGGVYVTNNGIFTMNSGTISNNTSESNGGGVGVNYSGTFNMNGGIISGNNAYYRGGGVAVSSGIFNITNGTIYGLNEIEQTLKNTTTFFSAGFNTYYGAALQVDWEEIGRYGSDSSWIPFGDSSKGEYYIQNTIRVVNGVLQP